MKRPVDVAIIGAGAVGTSLAHAIRSNGYRIAAVVSRRRSSARKLAASVRARRWGTDTGVVPREVSVIVIAVPDGEIPSVVRDLAGRTGPARRTRRVFHTSGAGTSDLLRPLTRNGWTTCSIHPIFSFARTGHRSARTPSMRGEWYGIEGRPDAVRWAASFVRSLGGRPVVVPKSKKTLYHVACTFASNYPLSLMRAAEQSARLARLDGGLRPLMPLLVASIRNGLENGAIASLTGPVVRGDARTLRLHRSELRKHSQSLARLLDALIHYTAEEARRAGRTPPEQQRSVRRVRSRTARKER